MEARLMALDTPKGLTFPESTDHTRIWEHVQNLATDVDGALGAKVCTSTTRPSSPYQGQTIYETDTRLLRFWDGSAWQIKSLIGAWYTYTPTIYDGDVTVTSGVSAVEGTYTRIGQTVIARGFATLANATANGTGVSLPVQAAARVFAIGSAGVYGSGAPSLQTGHAYMNTDLSGVSRLVIVTFGGGFLNNAAGNSIRFQAIYQAGGVV
jgi:hypothetical protein